MPDMTYGCLGLSLLCLILYHYAWLARTQGAAVLTPPAMVLAGVAAVVVVIAGSGLWSALPRSSATKGLALCSVCTLVLGGSLVAEFRVLRNRLCNQSHTLFMKGNIGGDFRHHGFLSSQSARRR